MKKIDYFLIFKIYGDEKKLTSIILRYFMDSLLRLIAGGYAE